MIGKRLMICALPLTFSTVAAAATVYDLADEFRRGGAPDGHWSYGYAESIGGPFIAATKHKVNHNGLEYWVPRHGGNPFTAYNPTDEVASVGPIRFVPGVVVVHPGPLREYVVDRLIVPDAGLYAVTGGFAGADTRGALTDVYVVLDGGTIFSGVVDGFGSASRVSFSFTEYLPAGATLDFMVGTNGVDYLQDATTVSARIAAVPEPATLPMLGGGLAVLALAARRGRCFIGTSDA